MTTYSTNTFQDQSNDVNYQTWINEVLTALGTIGLTQTADVCQLTAANYNASIVVNAQTATNVLTVNSITSGGNNICVGMQVVGAGIAAGTYIQSVGTGTGGTGTYTLSTTPGTIAAESMTISLKAPNTTSIFDMGYTLWRFNDTLQATQPIFFKLEFGSNSSGANYPSMFITVGTGSNGSGTITWTGFGTTDGGVASYTKVTCGSYNSPGQTTTNYTSRYCYSATQGFLGVVMKIGMGNSGVAGTANMGFMIARSVNGAGAPTGDSVVVTTNSSNTSAGFSGPYTVFISYTNSTVYGPSVPNTMTYNSWWPIQPGGVQVTMRGSLTAQVLPALQIRPSTSTGLNLGYSNFGGLVITNEWALHATGTVTMLGSTSLTYINVGILPWGNAGSNGYQTTYWSVIMLWQ